jgi:peptidoglycan/xylan/chitin deacetylase (PgdA/CDA1 family)
MTIDPSSLDDLVEFLLSTRGRSEPRLTVSFDDGYEDSARYIQARAKRFPDVEWIFFICPAKIESRVGFRWDLAEQSLLANPDLAADREMPEGVDVAGESRREDLRRVAAMPQYRLADLELCWELQRLRNVALGNHTNSHMKPVLLSPEEARAEYDASIRDFERLFGPHRQFAFPFGAPEVEFDATHVAVLRQRGEDFVMWSTEQRPYESAERRPGAVLPRFPIDGTHSWRQAAFDLIVYTARARARRSGPRYEEGRVASGDPGSWAEEKGRVASVNVERARRR